MCIWKWFGIGEITENTWSGKRAVATVEWHNGLNGSDVFCKQFRYTLVSWIEETIVARPLDCMHLEDYFKHSTGTRLGLLDVHIVAMGSTLMYVAHWGAMLVLMHGP